MSSHENAPDISEIRTIIEQWAASVQNCDIDGALAHHGRDVVMFDVPPPEQGVRGIEAYEASWPGFFEWMEGGARFEIDEIRVDAGSEVAYAWALLRCGTDDDLRNDPDRRLRLSVGLRQRAGAWEILHEHHSFTHP